MARLTEEMVIARSRVSDLAAIKKLNCWGGELTDVSLLRRMLNLEVLSISVNKIASLADFQYCKRLRELYVRNNEIRALNQICYLQELPALRILWLAENPCAKEDVYRLTVLKALPHLEKLDDVVVQPEEVEDALRKGRDLIHPEDTEALPVIPPAQSARPTRTPPRPVNQQRAEPEDYTSPTQPPRPIRRPLDLNSERLPPRPVGYQVADSDDFVDEERHRNPRPLRTTERPLPRPANYQVPEPEEFVEEDRYRPPGVRRPSEVSYEAANGSDSGNGVCEKCYSPLSPPSPQREGEPLSNGDTNHPHTNTSNIPNDQPTSPRDRYHRQDEYRRRGSSSSSNGSGRSLSRTSSPPTRRIVDPVEDNYRYPTAPQTPHNNHPRNSLSSAPPRLSRPPPADEDQAGVERLQTNIDEFVNGSSVEHQRWIAAERDMEPRRSAATSNPNLLTAVICLIMELDYEGLLQVENTIRRRKDRMGGDDY